MLFRIEPTPPHPPFLPSLSVSARAPVMQTMHAIHSARIRLWGLGLRSSSGSTPESVFGGGAGAGAGVDVDTGRSRMPASQPHLQSCGWYRS